MATVVHKQANFTKGAIDPRLLARTDVDIFEKGAREINNFVILPQGGIERRWGTEYVDELVIGTTASEFRVAILEYEDETIYVLVFEPLSLKIYHQDALVATLPAPYSASQLPNIKWTQSINQLYVFHPDVPPNVLIRTAPHATWTFGAINFIWFPTYDFDRNYDTATFTPSAVTGNITLNATGSPFKASHVGGLFFGNEGTMRITTYVNANQVQGFTVEDFKSTATILGSLAVLTEPAWSSILGYPKTGTFYQDRLCVGGSKSLPQGLWMSKTNQYSNFDDSETLATSAIGVFINTNNSNVIEDILGSHTFAVFTSSGVVTLPFIDDSPLTPSNVSFNQQSRNGIGKIRSKLFDNGVIYIDRGGKMIWSMRYDVQRAGYVFKDISLISQFLINTPVEVGTYRNPDVDQGNFLIVINADGTLAILQSIDEQNVQGWTSADTQGQFRHLDNSEDQVYFIVERKSSFLTTFFLEKLSFNVKTDSASVQTLGVPSTTITGLGHLEANTVKVIADGFNLQDRSVSGGQITVEHPVTNVEVGLNYIPKVIPMPLSINTQVGNNFYFNKRIKTLWLDHYESLGIYIDNFEIPTLKMNSSSFGTPTPPRTGVYEHTLMLGWDPFLEIEITQQEPLPCIIRGLGFLVEVNEEG
jgi:hypothetical protein